MRIPPAERRLRPFRGGVEQAHLQAFAHLPSARDHRRALHVQEAGRRRQGDCATMQRNVFRGQLGVAQPIGLSLTRLSPRLQLAVLQSLVFQSLGWVGGPTTALVEELKIKAYSWYLSYLI
jgi:hypothetical protein